MIIDLTKHYVPEVYSNSDDYKVFLRILSVLATVLKSDIDALSSVYDPKTCPANLLPYLSDMVGYRYSADLPEKYQRQAIGYFPFLLRNRGSKEALKIATALSLSSVRFWEDTEIPFDDIFVSYDYNTGKISISYPSSSEIDPSIIEQVRPVGTSLTLLPSVGKTVLDGDLRVKVTAAGGTHEYSSQMASTESQVGTGVIAREPETETVD